MRTRYLVASLWMLFAVSCRQEVPETASAQPSEQAMVALAEQAPGSQANAETAQPAAKEPAASVPHVSLTPEEIEAGWIQLFDGQTLFGWQPNNDVNWSVTDGVIQADTGEQGLLLTTVPFADYELRCDFRLEKGGNSGVFLRTAIKPEDPGNDCYELNICDSHDSFATGSLVNQKKTDKPVQTEGEWHTFSVRLEGPRMQVKLDDQPILDFTDDSDPALVSGPIGLQKNQGKIEFRNVFLRPLGTQSLFNGKDLSGWREVPGSKSTFEVQDGTIHVSNGPGFWETEKAWANFILQADAITNGKELNSGIFFRAMPGTEKAPSHGYELQIHNGFDDGDRSKPNNSGTGAIFRRNKARWVMADDGKWCTMTLVAHDLNIAVWVNGIQVTFWTDDREPNENPRKGARREAGHISLQGHDPTTDLAFKGFRLAELP